MYYIFLIVYLIIISIISIIITITDKIHAIHHRRRVSENTLMGLAVIGGGITMYITMLIIRHKTRKLKFMLGIPLIIITELCLTLWVVNYVI